MTLTLPRIWIAVALAAGLVALATREAHPTAGLVVVAAGAIGLISTRTPTAARAPALPSAAVALAGMAAFGATMVAWAQRAPRVGAAGIVFTVVAAVAEEALFRHGLYVPLQRFGPLAAVTATAFAFALVHAPLYGWHAGGLDFAAGLVFGWQRWITGRWSVPAATHVFANLVAVL